MADQQVVVQPVLCFLVKRYGKSEINRLKIVTLNFYNSEAICGAKSRLTDDLECLNIGNIPHTFTTKRRDSKERCAREVDDIIAIIKLLDERKEVAKLPRYVADDPAELPSMNIVDGDMFVILDKIAHLEYAMTHLQFGLNSMHGMLHAFSRQQHAGQPPTNSSVHFTGGSSSSVAKNSSQGIPTSSIHPASNAQRVAAGGSKQQSKLNDIAVAAASVSNVTECSNRWSALMDLQSGYEASGDELSTDLPFSTVLNRSARRAVARASREAESGNKRRHESSPPLGESAAEDTDNTDGAPTSRKTNTKKRKKKRTMVIGTGTPVDTDTIDDELNLAPTNKVVAAEQVVRKAVFIVDNVSTTASEEDIAIHAEKQGIHVLTVYKVDTRRTPSEIRQGIDAEELKSKRHAFRVCIDRADVSNMLTKKNWFKGVIVDWWKFKPRNENADAMQPNTKKPRSDINNGKAAAEAAMQQSAAAIAMAGGGIAGIDGSAMGMDSVAVAN